MRWQHGGAAWHPLRAPYEISALGDEARLRDALAGSEPIQIYQQYVEAYGLVFQVVEPKRAFPAHEGSLDLVYARPYTGFGLRSDSGKR